MKQGLLRTTQTFVLGSVLALVSQAPSTAHANTIDDINILNDMVSLDTAQVEERLPYETIYNTLESSCTSADIAYADKKLDEFMKLKTTKALFKYNNSIRKQIVFDTHKKKLFKLLETQENADCAKVYFLYSSLEAIQNIDSREDLITIQHNNAKEPLFQELTEYYLQERMHQLVADNIFSEQEIKTFDNNLYVEYIQSCGKIHGSFHMLVWPDGRREVSKIVLKINECTKDNYLKQFSHYVDQIVVHELGHYLYYFKDSNHNTFNTMCRNDNASSSCTRDNFVSRYAQTSQEEDYAESFAYWYLIMYSNSHPDEPHKHDPANRIARNRKTRKLNYFNKLFQ